jgi:phosphate transport system substrate-binding protein
MSKIFFMVMAILVIGATLFTSCSPAAPVVEVEEAEEEMALSGQLQLAGSTTVQPLAEVLAESFMDANTDVSIDVQGGGSSVGVTAAGEGTADIGMSSRAIKDSEFEVFPNLQVFTIAYDGIAVVVNPSVELPTLSEDEVRAIFSGTITNFADVGGIDARITVVSREEGSGTRAAFEDLVMEYKDDAGEKVLDLITETALLQQSNGQVRTIVAETPNTIGYISFGFLDDSVTGVPINDVSPSVDNVINGSYPIFRPLNMETGGEPGNLAKAFLDFILSPDGQVIVAEDYIRVE